VTPIEHAEQIKRLADEYAHCYSFVGDDTMPRRKAELQAAIDSIAQRCAAAEQFRSGARSYLVDALAMELAEADGYEGDEKHRLIWSGGAVPEPEGEVWQRYQGKAAALADAALTSVAEWSASEDEYVDQLYQECIQDRDDAIARAEAAEAKLAEAEADAAKLRAFAQELFSDWPEAAGVDGFALQDIAVKHGLLQQKDPPPREPCSEHCACAEYYPQDEFAAGGVICYRRTRVLLGADQAMEGGQQ